ncbi:proteasome protein [Amycolatopsis antarctica]|uniref:Proteasome protein n=1 Tax=Amycolatopsis antarctica TaxID=1854586 RepID=A0A263CZG6_9PSEU|nr:PAC2 family protein [Amycolatopsis antarctica]OZM71563.1 proteasome protein [Amycolatopsis antarctica]
MVQDPTGLYEVDSDVPDVTGAVLLEHLSGFVDAGAAGSLLTEHLLATFEHRVVARFDTDQLVDYRARRPAMGFETDRWVSYEVPELVVYLLHDAEHTPFLLLTGPEPDSQWERFVAAVRSLMERWEVRMSIGFHGIPMGVPHTRPLLVSAHATRSGLIDGHEPMHSRIQVPGSASSLLEYRLGEAGADAAGFAAQVPHYLGKSSYPSAALTLLESVARTAGLVVPDEALRDSARTADAEIARQVAESDEVAEVVHALERQYDAFKSAEERGSLLAEVGERIPSGDELASELEQFLAEYPGQGDR